ncbi:histidine triad nucleotide-binding protein [Candidatus Latescibacterota bacterium]
MPDCIFCKIAAGEIPTDKIYEDDTVLAFPDISPIAPVHVLIIPKTHYATTLDMSERAPELFGSMMKASSEIARKKGTAESGFRIIFNTNPDGGQEIFHVHMHLLGGEPIGRMRAH